jgi:hypothetical protein
LPAEAKRADFKGAKVGQLQLHAYRGPLSHTPKAPTVSLPGVAALKPQRYTLGELPLPDHPAIHQKFQSLPNSLLDLLWAESGSGRKITRYRNLRLNG